jgi:hypothetical protein
MFASSAATANSKCGVCFELGLFLGPVVTFWMGMPAQSATSPSSVILTGKGM